MQKSLYIYIVEILHKGLKSLNKLDVAEEAERVAIAKTLALTNDFNFPKIPLNSIVKAAF
jgi:hypothetical protein